MAVNPISASHGRRCEARSPRRCAGRFGAPTISTVALLNNKPNPTDAEIDLAVTNICRCGTYNRVRRAIHLAAELQGNHKMAPTKV